MKKYTCIDLFSGAGGLSRGFLDAGFNVVLGVDFDDAALKTFECNHGSAKAMKLDLFNHDNIEVIVSYLKQKNITLDDLRYLAKYDPDCFRKTCENVVYNIPESKEIMQPTESAPAEEVTTTETAQASEEFNVFAVLENLKNMDADESFYKNVDAKRVKNLLGNLFMELLFPHNDKETFIYEDVSEDDPTFDMKA